MTIEDVAGEAARRGHYQARTGWPAVAAVAAAIVLFLTSTMAGAVGQLVYMRLAGATAGEAPGATLTFLGTMQLVLVLLVLLASRAFRSRARDVLALVPSATGWRGYVYGLLGLLGLVGAMDVVMLLLKPEPIMGDMKPFVGMIRSDLWWLTLLVVGIGAPLSEELLFRGFLQSALAQTRLGFLGATLVTTSTWTALHANYSILGIIQVGVIGIYLSWLLWRTGSLKVTMFCHGAYNAVMTLLIGLGPMPGS